MFSALGASPSSINLSEVYSALQTKVVDGQENPLVTIDTAKFYEVQKYCALTNHMWDGYWFIGNRRAWERLPTDLKEIVSRNINDAALLQRTDVENLGNTLKAELQAKGLEFTDPDRPAFREALRKAGFYDSGRRSTATKPGVSSRRPSASLGKLLDRGSKRHSSDPQATRTTEQKGGDMKA